MLSTQKPGDMPAVDTTHLCGFACVKLGMGQVGWLILVVFCHFFEVQYPPTQCCDTGSSTEVPNVVAVKRTLPKKLNQEKVTLWLGETLLGGPWDRHSSRGSCRQLFLDLIL